MCEIGKKEFKFSQFVLQYITLMMNRSCTIFINNNMTDWKMQRLGNFLEYADYRTLPVNSNTELTFKQSLMNGGTEYVYSSNL